MTRTRLAAALALAATTLTLVGAAATPATAADTLVTFTVDPSGALNLSAPGSALFDKPAAGGASVSDTLGTVTVTDSRNNPASAWTATVSTTDATHTSNPGGRIAKANISYTTGIPTKQGATAVVVPGATAPTALGALLPVITTSISSGSTVSWTPTLEVRVPAGTPAGEYTMTVTHSVS